jgi:hypothetical protein
MATLMGAAIDLLSKDLDDYWVSVTTAAGDAAKSYLVDDLLHEKVPEWVSDGMVIYLPAGPSGVGTTPETRVVDSLRDSNHLVTKTSFSAQVATAAAYEVHRLFTRNQKLAALRQAASLICPSYHAVVRDMSLSVIANQYEYDISSLAIYQNRPHQVLIAQDTIRSIWVKATPYVIGDYVRPTTLAKFTGYVYKCTTAGTSAAATEPTWPTTIDGTVADGTGALVWTCQEELDYSNYPMLPLHDWDITPDGRLFLNTTYDAGRKLMIVGIKPLAFTGSGASETIALDSPYTLVLSAQAIIWLCQQKISSAGTKDATRWTALKQMWEQTMALRKAQYPMKPPDGTIISGPGLTV